MKRKIQLLVVAVLLLIVFSLLGGFSKVLAAGCLPQDYSKFPYGFLCPFNPDDHSAVTVDVTTPLTAKELSDRQIVQGKYSSLSFSLKFNPSDKARTKPQSSGDSNPGIIKWAIVNYDNTGVFGGFSSISNGEHSQNCPGTGRAIVYNFQDNNQGTSPNGNNQSPSAYKITSGYEDCGPTTGRMIAWTSPGDQNGEENFTVNLDRNHTGSICVRYNISVSYTSVKDSNGNYYPGGFPTGPRSPLGTNIYNDYGNTASRIAKQSADNYCFEVVNHEPVGQITALSCSNFKIRGYDPDHPNDPIRFRVFRIVGGVARVQDFNTSTSQFDTQTRDGDFIVGNTYYAQFYDPDAQAWLPAGGTGSANLTGSCGGDQPYCDYLSVTADNGVVINGRTYNTTRKTMQIYDPTSTYGGNNSNASRIARGQFPLFADQTINVVSPGTNKQPVQKPLKTVYYQVYTEYLGTTGWRSYGTPERGSRDCYSATCRIQSVTGNRPDGKVMANTDYTVTYSITNNIPDRPLNHKYVDGSVLNLKDGGPNIAVDKIDPLQTIDNLTWVGHANDNATPYPVHISWTPWYWNHFDLGPPCEFDFGVYKAFSVNLFPSMRLDDDEDPSIATYKASANVNSPVNISVPTDSWVTKPDGTTVVSRLNDNTTYLAGSPGPTHDTIPENTLAVSKPVIAGQKYCTKMQTTAASGIVGPGGVNDRLFDSGPTLYREQCPPIVNKPFYKVTGNGVSVGSDYQDKGCGGTGVLAAFSKRWDDPTSVYYWYGSGAQYQALSKGKNSSFGSNQLTAFKSPTELTFANDTAQVNPNQDDQYGGNLGSSPCLPELDPDIDPAIIQSLPSNTLGSKNLATDSVTIIKTTGDVYINGDIKYTGSVSPGHAPIFMLYTTGNINIAPGVKELYGMYFAKSTNATNGVITTCAQVSGPYPANNTYDNCANQLVVRGNFIARKVNMTRTYGSLRDEKPVPGVPAKPITGNNGIHKPLVWINNSTGFPAGYKKCQQIVEPSEPRGATFLWDNPGDTTTPSTGWDNNWFCLAKDDEDGGLNLTWSRGGSGSPKPTTGSCTASIGQVIQDAKGQTEKGWSDNYLCINDSSIKIEAIASINDPTNGNRLCTRMYEPDDGHAGLIWKNPTARVNITKMYICVDKFKPGTFTDPIAPHAPDPLLCSIPAARGGQEVSTQGTCAAEIFKFNPSMYLAKPIPGTGGSNSIKFDSITSLPPVL